MILLTRPRRFGKTLGLSTVRTFFEDERNKKGEKIDNLHYFAGTKIMSEGEHYCSHAGQYPVIKMSLKSTKQPDFEIAYAFLVDEITEEFDRHRYVAEAGILTENERQMYEMFLNRRRFSV